MRRTRFKKLAAAALMAIALGAGLTVQNTIAQSRSAQQQVVIIADLHKGNPVRTNEQYRQRITNKLKKAVQDLQLGYEDQLLLRTAGNVSPAEHVDQLWNRDIQFSYRRSEPADVPGLIDALMQRLPQVKAHQHSGLVWAVERLQGTIDCRKAKVTLIVLSNGLEAGSVKGGEFRMRTFDGQPFQGCDRARVLFLGFGAVVPQNDPNVVEAARRLFRRVFRQAGFGTVEFEN